MSKSIYVFSSGKLERKHNTIYFEDSEGKRKYIPIENTRELHIFGEVSLNKKILEYLSQKEILLHFTTITVIILGALPSRALQF